MSSKRTKLVPKLRFPEFKAAEEWKAKTLREVCLRITNGKANAEDHEEGGAYPLFDRSAVIKRSNAFMFDSEAVILPGEGMRFIPKYFDGKFNLHQRAYALMEHQGNARFVYYSLDYLKDLLAKKAVKSTVLSLRLPIVENFLISFPPVPEQQKIADCLSSLDELIAAQTRKVDALKTHKKGLMQQLFPREGETQPRLRFPEFQDARGWEVGLISDLATTVMGNAFRSTDFVESGTQVVRIGNLYQGELQLARAPVYLSDTQAEENSKFGVHPLDLLMSMTGTVGKRDYGFVIQVPTDCKRLLLNQRVMKLAPTVKCDPGFLLQLLKADRLLDAIYSVPGGTKQANLSAQHIKDLSISYPPKSEQQRIASCFSRLDALITLETQELATLKTHKKGLMQQLFPSSEAVEA